MEHVLPRRTKFSRRAAGKRAVEQVLAANIDTVFIVASLEKRLRPRTLERYLTLTKHSGADPVIVLTKSDLCADPTAALAGVRELVGDIPVHTVSALTSDDASKKLRPYLVCGKTATVLGMSGAGKSTLVNHWTGQQTIATGDVRGSDKRGRHTTTHRHLIQLPWGAVVIDTPGMRELQLWETGSGLGETFEDVGSV
ncbi:MAG: GTPase RsgA, partial [Verrucomicrobiales bacterium]|nr:GTPase RsgA [Verrucomicrobiales bacterium]